MARTLDALQDLRRQDRAPPRRRRPLRRHRGLPPRRAIATSSSPGCATRSGSSSRSSRPPRRRGSSSPAARRCCIRACPTRSSSTSAAARPRSSGCASGAAAAAAPPSPEILGSISLPFGVVTFTERFGGVEVTPAIYRAMVAEAEAALAPFERAHRIRRRIAGPAGADARQLGHGDDAGRRPSGACRAISARWSTAAR